MILLNEDVKMWTGLLWSHSLSAKNELPDNHDDD